MPIVLSLSSNPNRFEARNFMFVPIVTPPAHTGFWGLIILSGVAVFDFQGQVETDWTHDTVTLDLTEDSNKAIGLAPYRPQPGYEFQFEIHQSVPFATVNSRFHQQSARVGSTDGTAADAFRRVPTAGLTILEVDVAVRDLHS